MDKATIEAFAIGAFWAALMFASVYLSEPRQSGMFKRVVAASKAAVVAFVVMALLARGCAFIKPIDLEDTPECARYPGIYGC